MNFNGDCLIKNNVSIPKKVINLYISYKLGHQLRNLNTDFTLGNCLFASVKLTKNPDLDKNKYTGYGIGFDSRSEFLFTDRNYGKNVIIFGADMSSSEHADNKEKDILNLGEEQTQRFDDTTLFLFVNATKVYQFKTKNLEIKDYALCLGNISKDFTINNLKKQD